MLSSLNFALNATLPVFLVMVLGWLLRRWGVLNDGFCGAGNQYVFKCALPVSLFSSISGMDFYQDFNWTFVIFCMLGTIAMFSVVWLLTWLLMKERTMVGAFAQASCRSSAAILGVAFALNIYGDSGMVPMMIVAAVPFFNLFAVLILSLSPHSDKKGNLLPPPESPMDAMKKTCFNIVTNPIILGIVAGIPFALLRIELPVMATKTIEMVGGTASPVALLVIGAGFNSAAAIQKWKPAVAATFIKLFALPAIYLPLAACFGFGSSEMLAILIMVGSPTTVACYVMAEGMQNDGVLTSNVVLLSTLLSAFSLTLWIFLLRVFALL